MLMQDRVKTRVRPQGVTSYAPDKGINYTNNSSWPTIHMTIGSVVLVLAYDKDEVRDADIERLDEMIDKD
jgi:hypothetical protein